MFPSMPGYAERTTAETGEKRAQVRRENVDQHDERSKPL